jgi:hypothetical membrane protein
MDEMITVRGGGVSSAASETTMNVTRALLACGVVAGPLFYAVVAVEMLVRPGFDIRRHPISLLSLGDLGWIQMSTFVLCGLGGVACAVGIRRALRHRSAGTWGPLLVGLYGLGLIGAGAFTADPSLGFPPGTAQGMPDHLSWHAVLHGVAFFTTFTAVVVACAVFARRFAALKQWAWTAFCVAAGLVAPAIVVLGMINPRAASVPFALAGVVAFGWVSVLALRLMADLRVRPD